MENFDADKTMDAVWCIDSETGRQYLLDRKTGQVIAEKDDNGNIVFQKAS